MITAHDFTLEALDGTPLPLAAYRGQLLLIANTASRCGFTPQYAGLQRLWEEYRDRGLVVLGVPSNDFGGQEPGSNADIAGFCERNYGVSFPMAAKTPVRGGAAHPLFRWLAYQGGILARPRWNFYKYIVGADGRIVSWFSSIARPDAARVRRSIQSQLLALVANRATDDTKSIV